MDFAAGGNVVASLTIGNTRIKICDDYCRSRTPDEVDKIMNHIAQWAREPLAAASQAKERKAQNDGSKRI